MPKRTNILLITSDQQHWTTIGCTHPELETPNLDRLVREGMRFNRAYCPNPTCTPTRASIITGKYPSQHGAYSLGTKLPEAEHTVGEDFQAAGYRTALVGKARYLRRAQVSPDGRPPSQKHEVTERHPLSPRQRIRDGHHAGDRHEVAVLEGQDVNQSLASSHPRASKWGPRDLNQCARALLPLSSPPRRLFPAAC